MNAKLPLLIAEIRDLANANYNAGYGWQVIVECMDDTELGEALTEAGADTHAKAHRWARKFAKLHTEHHDEIASTAW